MRGSVNCALKREPCAQHRPSPIVGGWAVSQIWLFWVAPLIGGVLAGGVYRWVGGDEPKPVPVTGKPEAAGAS